MGFAVPVASLAARIVRPLVSEYVLGPDKGHDLFDAATVRRFWSEHQSGMRDRTTALWGILVFNLWYERFARATPGVDARAPTAAEAAPAEVSLR